MKAVRIFLVAIVLLAIAVPLTAYIALCYPHVAHGMC